MKKLALFIAFASFFLFTVFTLIVKQDLFEQIDFDTTVRLQNNTPHSLDTTFSLFSMIGAAEIISLFLLPLFLIYRWKSIVIAISYATGLFVEVVGKVFLDHPGPPHLFFRNDINVDFPSSHVTHLRSYPSGHSYRTVFVIAVWLYVLWGSSLPRSQKIIWSLPALGVCGIMLLSRVTLGEHWTSDVIGGSLLGLGFALGSVALLKSTVQTHRTHDKITSHH